MKVLGIQLLKAVGVAVYVPALLLWWLSYPIRRYFRWLETIIVWRIRGNITRRQLVRKFGQWWLAGAIVQYAGAVLYFWLTGQITLGRILAINHRDVWGLIDEEMVLFAMFLPSVFLAAFLFRWGYQRDLLLKSTMKRIETTPGPKDKQAR